MKNNIKMTALTADTISRFHQIVDIDALTPEQIAKVEHNAYCANMGAESKEAAWAWFVHLCVDVDGIEIPEDVKKDVQRIENEINANTLINAIEKLANSKEHLYNFASYLTYHFPEWLKKYANDPENLATEFMHFATIEF